MNFRLGLHQTVLLAASLLAAGAGVAATPAGYILQSNDYDPTTITSQPTGREYHWLGVDAVVTHLETGLAVDSAAFAGRGQRIDLISPSPLTALQVKIKRIGSPGALRWEAGTAEGKSDLGMGEVPPELVSPHYEHFVTLTLNGARPGQVYLRLQAASGQCPEDYYAVYCTWRKTAAVQATLHNYVGTKRVPMMFRAIRADPHGAALEPDGREVEEGASMMTRLLTAEAGPGRRELMADEEEPYSFVDRLAAGVDPRREGLPWPNARPEPGEIAIGSDWRIVVAAPRSPQVETAAEDLRRFLADSMKRLLPVTWDSRVGAAPMPGSIVLAEGEGAPGGPQRSGGYRFQASPGGILLQGKDARGTLRAAWYLEDLLTLRGGPWVKPDDRVREPRYSPRATCSAWGGMGELAASAPVYTDEHLSLISHYGYDAIWLGWYSGPEAAAKPPTQIAPGRTPEGTSSRPFTARLRDLTERAEKFDLQVVILYDAPYPANAAEGRDLEKDARTFLAEVPKIKQFIFVDEGMGSTRHGLAAWVDTCNLLTDALRAQSPDVDVAAWSYTLQSNSPTPASWNKTLEQAAQLDPRIDFLSNFDTKWARRRDGRLEQAFDYNICLQAPAVDFRYDVDFLEADARRRGQAPRKVWAKIETRIGQESDVQPEIPCVQKWAERFDAVNTFDSPPLSSIFANWYHTGFFPTPVTELFGWMSYTHAPPSDQIIRSLARRDFGPGQEDLVVAAWQDFSDAIWDYPFYFGLTYTMNTGPAQPFWLDPRAPNPRPWRRGFVNSLAEMDLLPLAQQPAGPHYSPKFPRGNGLENRQRLEKLNALWTSGLAKLTRALEAAPPEVRARAEDNWRNAKSFGNNAETTLRLVRWLDARGRLEDARSDAEQQAACDDLARIGREELAAARQSLPMYLRDSQLGFLNHGRGVFTAQTVADKIDLLEKTLDLDLPARRAQIGQRTQ